MKKAIACILMLCVLLAHVPCLGEKMTGVFDFDSKTVLLNSGYTMPIMGLGTYALDYDTCVNSVMALIANGGRLIDTAYMYGNEEAVGEGVRRAMAEYGVPREEIFVITKIYPNQFGNPEAAIDMALEKLDIGYIDMMLLHHPGSNDVRAYLAMEKYAAEGKIRSLGLSNWYIEELTDFLPQVNIKPALVQNEIHPTIRSRTWCRSSRTRASLSSAGILWAAEAIPPNCWAMIRSRRLLRPMVSLPHRSSCAGIFSVAS